MSVKILATALTETRHFVIFLLILVIRAEMTKKAACRTCGIWIATSHS